jgi:hypothetical protein
MPTNDVAFSPLGSGKPLKQGYVVTSVLPTGSFQDLAPVCSGVDTLSVAEAQAIWSARLLASGSTPVVTR